MTKKRNIQAALIQMLGCHDFQKNAAGKFMKPNSLFLSLSFFLCSSCHTVTCWFSLKSSSSNSNRVLLSSSNYFQSPGSCSYPVQTLGAHKAPHFFFLCNKTPCIYKSCDTTIPFFFVCMTEKKQQRNDHIGWWRDEEKKERKAEACREEMQRWQCVWEIKRQEKREERRREGKNDALLVRIGLVVV